MTDFHFNYQDLIRNGWDGNLDSLDEFKEQLKSMLELGWNPKEMTMQEFAVRMAYKIRGALVDPEDEEEDPKLEDDLDVDEEDDEEDDYKERRQRAEEMGWDEEEMDLEEFEDLFM